MANNNNRSATKVVIPCRISFEKCEKEDGVVRLTMKNGEVIELGVR